MVGFNEGNARYVAISGESHKDYVKDAQNIYLRAILGAFGDLPAELVDYVNLPPGEGQAHEPTNLPPYGTTGLPALHGSSRIQ